MENIKRMIFDINEALDMYDEIVDMCKINNYDLEGKYNQIDLERFIRISRICRAEFRFRKSVDTVDNCKLLNRYCEVINDDIIDIKNSLKSLLDDQFYSFHDNGTWYHESNLKELLIDALKSWDYIFILQKLYEK